MSKSPQHALSSRSMLIPEFDAIVVGTGIAEVYVLHRLRAVRGLSVRVYDIADDVDASLDQSRSRIVSAVYDDANNRWDIEAADGTRARARFMIVAAGDQALATMGIRGRNGLALEDAWAHGPRAYLGMAVRRFPNLFLVTAQTTSHSPSVRSLPLTAEDQVDFLSGCIAYMFELRLDYVEVTLGAERRWAARADAISERSLSHFRLPGREICDEVVAKGYEGFSFDRPVAVVDVDPMLILDFLHRSPASAAA